MTNLLFTMHFGANGVCWRRPVAVCWTTDERGRAESTVVLHLAAFVHFAAILGGNWWSFYAFLKGIELCLAISGAALTLLCPVFTNLIIPYDL